MKLLRQRLDDPPLIRAGVLRLVDQDVVESAIQLVEDPGGGFRSFQQGQCAFDDVVKIQRALRRLAPCELGKRGRSQNVQRRRQVGALNGVHPFAHRQKTLLRLLKEWPVGARSSLRGEPDWMRNAPRAAARIASPSSDL